MSVHVLCDRCNGPVDMEGPRAHIVSKWCRRDEPHPGLSWQYPSWDLCDACASVVMDAIEAAAHLASGDREP